MPLPVRAAAFAAAARTILAMTLAVLLAMAGVALAADAPAGNAPPEKAAAAPAAGKNDSDDEDDEEDYQGMPAGEGREEVFGYCGTCHSLKLVTQQGLSRSDWAEVLVYMVEEQEMAALEPEDEKLILDYLARFYGPDRRARKMAQ